MTTFPQQRASLLPPSSGEDRHRRYYQIGGVTIEVQSDLPISDRTFSGKFRSFCVEGPGSDTISIHHHFGLPELVPSELGREVYRRPPWVIYSQDDGWTYLAIAAATDGAGPYSAAAFKADYSRGDIFHASADRFLRGGIEALTLFPTDQILLAQVLGHRSACMMHSAAAILDDNGFLFVGHSDAGKSTVTKMLDGRAEILCDDRNIVRRWPDGFRVHGTWSHGEIASVSGSDALLRAVFFLRKSKQNRLVRLTDGKAVLGRLLACLIRPLTSADWWEKSLRLVGVLVREVPCYEMQFDRSGRIIRELERLSQSPSRVAEETAV
ncbi:hypothetical protein ACFL5Q_06295 [Planctomycetota bacterium]